MTRASLHAARAARFVVGCACFLGTIDALAQAGPPLITDDPGTPGDGHWEINLAWTTERSADAHKDEAPLADINYGVGDRVQLKFEMPWIVGTGRANNGFDDALVGVKWRFFDQGDGGWQVSMYPQASFLPPELHHASPAESGVGYLLPIEVQRDFGAFDAGIEVGRTLAPGSGDDGWIAGFAMGRQLSERFELLGELHDEITGSAGAHELIFNVGTRAKLAEHLTLLASLGTDVDNTIEARNRWVSYLALQLNL